MLLLRGESRQGDPGSCPTSSHLVSLVARVSLEARQTHGTLQNATGQGAGGVTQPGRWPAWTPQPGAASPPPTWGPGGPACPGAPSKPCSPWKRRGMGEGGKGEPPLQNTPPSCDPPAIPPQAGRSHAAPRLTAGPGIPRSPSEPGCPGGPWAPTGPVLPGGPSGPGCPWGTDRQTGLRLDPPLGAGWGGGVWWWRGRGLETPHLGTLLSLAALAPRRSQGSLEEGTEMRGARAGPGQPRSPPRLALALPLLTLRPGGPGGPGSPDAPGGP